MTELSIQKLEIIYDNLIGLREYLELEETKIGNNDEMQATKGDLLDALVNDCCFIEEVIREEK